MKKFAVFLGVVLVLISVWFMYTWVTLPAQPVETVYVDETFTFVTTDGETIVVQYDETAEFALVEYADNQYELTQVESGSGTQYASGNGLVVFSEHQDEVRLNIGADTNILAVTVGNDGLIEQVTDLGPVVSGSIEVADVPVLGQRCVDSAVVDCASLEAAASVIAPR